MADGLADDEVDGIANDVEDEKRLVFGEVVEHGVPRCIWRDALTHAAHTCAHSHGSKSATLTRHVHVWLVICLTASTRYLQWSVAHARQMSVLMSMHMSFNVEDKNRLAFGKVVEHGVPCCI